MPIHDLGYRRWKGRLTPTWMRWQVIAEAGFRLVWKSSWVRRMLFFAWMPAASVGFFFFLYEQSLEDNRVAQLRQTPDSVVTNIETRIPNSGTVIRDYLDDPEAARHDVWALLLLTFFRLPQGVLMILLVGLIAPTLIAQDVRSRAFLLYFSRPLTPWEYVLGKATVVWLYLALITTLPALTLYVLGVLLSPELEVIFYTWDLPLRIIAASIVLAVPSTALALLFSSMTTESRYAGFAWFAVWVLGFVSYAILTRDVANSPWTVVSLYHVLGTVQSWIFGLETNVNRVLPCLVLLVGITALSTLILLRRVAAPTRI